VLQINKKLHGKKLIYAISGGLNRIKSKAIRAGLVDDTNIEIVLRQRNGHV